MTDTPRKTQKERLLEILLRGTVSNFELRNLQPAIFQIGTRLFELKQEGYDIVTRRDENDRRKFYYSLRQEMAKDLFQAA